MNIYIEKKNYKELIIDTKQFLTMIDWREIYTLYTNNS